MVMLAVGAEGGGELPPLLRAALATVERKLIALGHAPMAWQESLGGGQYYCACNHCGCTVVVRDAGESYGLALSVRCSQLRSNADVKRAIDATKRDGRCKR